MSHRSWALRFLLLRLLLPFGLGCLVLGLLSGQEIHDGGLIQYAAIQDQRHLIGVERLVFQQGGRHVREFLFICLYQFCCFFIRLVGDFSHFVVDCFGGLF